MLKAIFFFHFTFKNKNNLVCILFQEKESARASFSGLYDMDVNENLVKGQLKTLNGMILNCQAFIGKNKVKNILWMNNEQYLDLVF